MRASGPVRGRGEPRLASVASKKRRRSQLARATTQRQHSRREQRLARRRRQRLFLLALGVLAALVALVAWIVTHQRDTASAQVAPGDYALVIEPLLHQATTTGGFR